MGLRWMILAMAAVIQPGCATAQTGGGSSAEAPDLLYVALQGEAGVAVVDMATREEVERIDLQALGFSANAKPHHVAVEPDGSHWYLSLIGENRVLKFDRANTLVAQAEFEVPGMLAVHPDEDLLLVGRSMSAVDPPARIGAIRRSDMDVEEVDVLFPRPHAIAVSADGGRVYTASLATNQIGAVELQSSDMELTTVDGPVHTLVQFAVDPGGGTLVGTGQLTGVLLVFDLSDPASPVLTDQVPVGRQPWHPVYSRDGGVAYVPVKMDDAVVAVDVTRGEVLWRTRDEGIRAPHGSALSRDGRYLFVSSNGVAASDEAAGVPGTLTVLDTSDGSVVKVLEMGMNTTGVGAPAR